MAVREYKKPDWGVAPASALCSGTRAASPGKGKCGILCLSSQCLVSCAWTRVTILPCHSVGRGSGRCGATRRLLWRGSPAGSAGSDPCMRCRRPGLRQPAPGRVCTQARPPAHSRCRACPQRPLRRAGCLQRHSGRCHRPWRPSWRLSPSEQQPSGRIQPSVISPSSAMAAA